MNDKHRATDIQARYMSGDLEADLTMALTDAMRLLRRSEAYVRHLDPVPYINHPTFAKDEALLGEMSTFRRDVSEMFGLSDGEEPC